MTSPTTSAPLRTRGRALTGALAALGLTVGMIMTSGALTPASAATWPTPTSSQAVTATISVSGTKDYGMKRLYGSGDLGSGGQDEDQDPILELAARRRPQERHHRRARPPTASTAWAAARCRTCGGRTSARTRRPSSAPRRRTSTPSPAAARRKASDKVFQFNGAGTLNISNFAVKNFGTLRALLRQLHDASTSARSTSTPSRRPYKGSKLVGINTNYGDSADPAGRSPSSGTAARRSVPCQKYIGNNTGKEPTTNGTDPDGTYCKYSSSDITYR